MESLMSTLKASGSDLSELQVKRIVSEYGYDSESLTEDQIDEVINRLHIDQMVRAHVRVNQNRAIHGMKIMGHSMKVTGIDSMNRASGILDGVFR